MQVVFLNQGESLIMPVTPPSYSWSNGRRIETLRLSEAGEVFRPGGRSRSSLQLPLLLPAQEYPWMEAGGRANPRYYLDRLRAWVEAKTVVRLILTDTGVNVPVYVESVTQTENDGSGDITAEVSLREYVELRAVQQAVPQTGNRPRTGGSRGISGIGESYTIRPGDSLSAICRRFYGKSTARYYSALARVNGIPNPHLIYPGKTIRIPPEEELLGGAR